MKILKGAVVAFSLAVSMGVFSTEAVACESGRVCFTPEQGIKAVLDGIATAQTAITNGAKGEEVADLIKKASDYSKEINANDKVDINRNKANNHLKAAIKSAKEGNLTETEEHLKKGKEGFEGLKKFL